MNEREFLTSLYDRVVEWRRLEGDIQVVEYSRQPDDSSVEYGPYVLDQTGKGPFVLEKASVLKHEDPASVCTFLVGGEKEDWKRHPFYRDMSLTWAFWYRMGPGRIKEGLNLDLRNLPHNTLRGDGGMGFIMLDSVSVSPRIRCFADDYHFGGREMKKWDKDRFLTDEGLEESLGLLKVVYGTMVRDQDLSVTRDVRALRG